MTAPTARRESRALPHPNLRPLPHRGDYTPTARRESRALPHPNPYPLPHPGDYTNGTAGKPLFVSLIVYPDEVWRQDWDAETLFLEPSTGAGLIVQPRPGRAVLMHQDVLHRVSTPSALACRPRYSLVWKLIFLPRPRSDSDRSTVAAARETICRPEWGEPVRFCGARRPTGV